MKNSIFKKILSTVLAASMVFVMIPHVSAAEMPVVVYEETRAARSIGMREIFPSLSINGEVASISVSIRPNSGYEYDLTITLQKKGLIFWGDEESWTVSGSSAKTVSKTASVSSGTYRVLVEGTVYDANGNEVDTVSETSESVT